MLTPVLIRIYDDFDHGDDLSMMMQSIRRRGAGLQNTRELELVPGKIFEIYFKWT